MDDKPRYSRISDIIQLIILMQSKINGVTLQDIQDEFEVSRRTAERMRDSIMNIMPHVEEIETGDRIKRWGFTNYSFKEIISFSAENIALLEKLTQNLDKITIKELQNIITKIKALNSKRITSIENEVEFLMHSEGFGVRQNPVYKIDLDTLSTIRRAIKESLKITVIYKNKKRILEPLGILFGEKIHLIARETEKGNGEYNYLLHKMKETKITHNKFDSKEFNIKNYANQSFGIYHGEIYDVKLLFSPDVAEDVLQYNFHPTQKIKQLEDGSVKVSFKASGDKHIIWHLFKWGDKVKILAPNKLLKTYKDYMLDILKNM